MALRLTLKDWLEMHYWIIVSIGNRKMKFYQNCDHAPLIGLELVVWKEIRRRMNYFDLTYLTYSCLFQRANKFAWFILLHLFSKMSCYEINIIDLGLSPSMTKLDLCIAFFVLLSDTISPQSLLVFNNFRNFFMWYQFNVYSILFSPRLIIFFFLEKMDVLQISSFSIVDTHVWDVTTKNRAYKHVVVRMHIYHLNLAFYERPHWVSSKGLLYVELWKCNYIS